MLVLAELRASLRVIAARRGVRVVKWLGDGAMISSADTAAVVALVIEAEAGVATSPLALDLRAGVASGPAIMFEGDDYIGRPVNIAARLCSVAAPREVLVSDAVIPGLPPWVAADGATTMSVRGFDRPLAVSSIKVISGVATAMDPVCGLTIPLESGVPLPESSSVSTPMFCSRACLQAHLDGSARFGGRSQVVSATSF